MITDRFNRRTIANMEVALERACQGLADGEKHTARQLIAARIVRCAEAGDVTLTGLTRAATFSARLSNKTAIRAHKPEAHRDHIKGRD
jgi:hypothetical protein